MSQNTLLADIDRDGRFYEEKFHTRSIRRSGSMHSTEELSADPGRDVGLSWTTSVLNCRSLSLSMSGAVIPFRSLVWILHPTYEARGDKAFEYLSQAFAFRDQSGVLHALS